MARRHRQLHLAGVKGSFRLAPALFWAPLLCLVGIAHAGVRTPLPSSTELPFTADLPVFFDEFGARVDLAAVIYHPDLVFDGPDQGPMRGQLRLELKLARQGEVAVHKEQLFNVEARDLEDSIDPARFVLLELSTSVPPGRWAVTVTVEDLKGGRGFGHRVSRAQGILEVPEETPRVAQLADPEYRHRSPSGAELPNPERLFGVNQDTLVVYIELSGAEAGRSYPVGIEIEDPQFGYMQRDSLLLDGDSERRAASYRLPMGTFLEGSYELRLLPRWNGGSTRASGFQVSWNLERLVQSARDVEVELELIFHGEDLPTIMRMPRAAQIEYLEAFWLNVDPTPGTEANEAYERFQQRVEYARQHFGQQGLIGPLTDRGRAHIRYGPPVEVNMEVVPTNDDALQEAIIMVHDPSQLTRYGTVAKGAVPLSEPVAEAESDFKRFQVGASRDSAFELWMYNLDGDRLYYDGPVWAGGLDLRLLFVDTLGTGEYLLVSSNDPNGRQ